MLLYIIFAVSAVAFPIRTSIRSNRILNFRQHERSILQYQGQFCQKLNYGVAIKRRYVYIISSHLENVKLKLIKDYFAQLYRKRSHRCRNSKHSFYSQQK